MYLTYAEYENLGGTLDETTFNDYEFEAECIVNWYTFNRLKEETEYPNSLKRCMYRLIQLAKLKADMLKTATVDVSSDGGTAARASIASQSNDGVSVSYNIMSASEVFDLLNAMSKGSEVDQIIRLYLQGVVNSLGRKVLYRGLYPGE